MNLPLCPLLSTPETAAGGTAPALGARGGTGRKGPPALWDSTQEWGYNQGPPALLGSVLAPSPSLLEHRAISGCVCVSVSPAKHFRVPQTRRLVPDQGCSSPFPSFRHPKRSQCLALGKVPGRSVAVPSWSRVPQGLSHRLPPERAGVIPVGFLSVFFPVFWELQVLMGPNPRARGSARCAPGPGMAFQ